MNIDSLMRIASSPKSIAMVVAGVSIPVLCFLVLRGRSHKKLNRTLNGASDADGDQTRWLASPWGLFIRPIVGYHRDKIENDLPAISAHFLSNDRFNFVLPAPFIMRAFKYRFWAVKSIRPISKPWRQGKWTKDPFLRLGRTIDGKIVVLTQESLLLILGIPDSGKSKIAYEILEQIGKKEVKSRVIVVDITRSFPKRICQAAGAARCSTIEDLVILSRELNAENSRRQGLLDEFDVDHVRHLPKGHDVEPIWIIIDEAHVLFSRDRDLKSEKGKKLIEVAEVLNEIIIVGRKTSISIVYLSQSALKSETLVNIGRARTIITGYLSPSESHAIGLEDTAVNPGLRRGVFLVRSAETGTTPVIMQAWQRDDAWLNVPDEEQNRG